ncbi:hypothetical protein OOZ63_27430 [Paucibacter sp. PLA-PC-4]|uniref:hypothetical protein n=1 Tax=Paucibacter sp. PLA-PC-4 TaxID=2993655 RepID=UPI00224B3CDB|nr:hypothetical protein [Paucibacter sp. PLA-PC-4]MCX2865559.1 hypothetical protein [Paucibacter sp. PLA-PC-4]
MAEMAEMAEILGAEGLQLGAAETLQMLDAQMADLLGAQGLQLLNAEAGELDTRKRVELDAVKLGQAFRPYCGDLLGCQARNQRRFPDRPGGLLLIFSLP